MSEHVTRTQEKSVFWLTMDDGKANALTHEIIDALVQNLEELAKDDSCEAVVIAGRPKFLSAGFDLTTMNHSPESANALLGAGGKLLTTTFKYPKPIVVATTGHAMAMGAILLLVGDYRVGIADKYKIGLNESAIGLPLPEVAIRLAHSKLNIRYLDRALAGAEIFSPEAAVEVGFLDLAVPADDLKSVAQREAERLGSHDSKAYATNKLRTRQHAIAEIDKLLPPSVQL